MTTAAILAGGRSSRMGGQNKSGLTLGAHRIIDRQLAVLRTVASQILIIGSQQDEFDDLNVPVIADALPGAGPLGGLYTALIASTTEQMLIVACDLPFLDARFLDHLAALGRTVDVAVPSTPDGYQPLCASYSRACAEPILRRVQAGKLMVTGFYEEVRVREIPPQEIDAFDPDNMMFFNVNTPLDYRRARSWIERDRHES